MNKVFKHGTTGTTPNSTPTKKQPQTSNATLRNLSSIPPPPPPPPLLNSNIRPIQWLPSHLKPKKKFQANVPMKKLNWPEIDPRNISKNAFWVKCKEDELASKDILAGLAAKFSQKSTTKKVQLQIDLL